MNGRLVRSLVLAISVCAMLSVFWLMWSPPRHPVALIRVVDTLGRPVAGAVIRPDGLRTKPGPYQSGHYGWRTIPSWPTNHAVRTDRDGYASVPYPKYVFERIETGQISFSVNHQDFVPDRPFRTVTTLPPAGAPWRVWVDYSWTRIRCKALIARADPVVLQKGAILQLAVRSDSATSKDARLFAQVSGLQSEDTDFWVRPEPAVIVTRRLAPGQRTVRAVRLDSDGSAWFSAPTNISAVAGQTNQLDLELRPGVTLHGQLDSTVPRPIEGGHVVAHVWPRGDKSQDPPQWHGWTTIREDGSFDLGSLPSGELEIFALSDGFLSTNGPGQSLGLRHPQKLLLDADDIRITIGMERTAALEVQVMDQQGKPLKDAQVSTWPNAHYGGRFTTILGSDCHNTTDYLRNGPTTKAWVRSGDFQAKSDDSGLALIRNLPTEVTEFTVDHPRFALPAITTSFGQKRRQASVRLTAGQTNRVTVHLEAREKSPISHY